ncbi:MAG: 23S rRNA (pseudouridine(1915)-N(3))-methyltransferase RlmH [Verrucomicrobiae bacterium]|nr:23S rRNA (pseudouridine(1915)-N(3))-methyltransferase RlmH [Verrucomicrobiae bacterium]
MKWKIVAVGKPALAFARAGVGEYLPRLKRYAPAEVVYLKESGSREENARRLLAASEGCHRLVLDERGDLMNTAALAEKIGVWEMDRVKEIAVLVGGADGHDEATRRAADLTLCLGRLTMQHELALVVTLEQLYRAYTVRRGEPYHR